MSGKRTNYLNWDQYFMCVALLSALRSKDPNTQVGACIVNQKKRIVGIGYNGLPYGCQDDSFPWDNKGDFLETKYPYIVHAEANAILNANALLDNCTLYVSLFPCHECVKLIIQSGIREIVFLSDKYRDSESDQAAKRMLDASGISYRKMPAFSVALGGE
ncbi:MAG: dCMP deaminase family protein [Acholeplasmataceae bacterium]|nr:dCMP deaminase family protein [Acholeplasmataceae bacterium]